MAFCQGYADNVSDFFITQNKPENLDDIACKLNTFCQRNVREPRRIALVTSGGTAVPLESRTVRFIDNFSSGNRGSASAEYFLAKGYAVIFLYRKQSLRPFYRHFTNHEFLDILQVEGDTSENCNIKVKDDQIPRIKHVLEAYHGYLANGSLLQIGFFTLTEYLFYLKMAAEALRFVGREALIYLAAAVSDFYVPDGEMPEHKIDSANGPLNVTLQPVPKMLSLLFQEWTPEAFSISFKLETNKELLLAKSEQALQKYKHAVVIGNILETRKRHVVLITKDGVDCIDLDREDMQNDKEIEEYIIDKLSVLHNRYCKELSAFSPESDNITQHVQLGE